jgi:hypothetical protein
MLRTAWLLCRRMRTGPHTTRRSTLSSSIAVKFAGLVHICRCRWQSGLDELLTLGRQLTSRDGDTRISEPARRVPPRC